MAMMMSSMMPMMMGMMANGGGGMLLPALLGKVLALKAAIAVAPAIGAIAFLFGQGATIICAQMWWRVLQYNRENKLRKQRRERLRGIHGPPPPPHGGRPLERLRSFMNRLIHGPPPPPPLWSPPLHPLPEEWAASEFSPAEYPVEPSTNHVSDDPDTESAHSIRNQNTVKYPESAPLDKEEYDKLMDWTKGAPLDLDFNVANATANTTVMSTAAGNLTILTTTMAPTIVGTPAKTNSTVIRLVYSTRNSTQMVPIKITRIKRRKDEVETESMFQKYRKSLDDNVLNYIRKDISNFFTIITTLDENKCIQKLVCDIHSRIAPSRKRSRQTRGSRPNFSPYEAQVLNAFKFMDILFEKPSNAQDSTTRYRKAAQLGKSMARSNQTVEETCQSYYKACGYSANDIMSFGNKLMAEDSLSLSSVLPFPLPSIFPTMATTTTTTTPKPKRAATEDKIESRAYKAFLSRMLPYVL